MNQLPAQHDCSCTAKPSNAQEQAAVILETLKSYNIDAAIGKWDEGNAVNRFHLILGPKERLSKIDAALDVIALALQVPSVRMNMSDYSPTPISIEVPRSDFTPISFQEMNASPEMENADAPLRFPLGKEVDGKAVYCDLNRMPHLLIGGCAGSGKSICLHSMICSLIQRNTQKQMQLILVDTKGTELDAYSSLPHLITPLIQDTRRAVAALSWAVDEMISRYSLFQAQHTRTMDHYNQAQTDESKKLSYIVIMVNELADLIEDYRKEAEEQIRRLAALARAAGIFLVMSTQRPTPDVVTGAIKNNIPSRIALKTATAFDSRNMLDVKGAETLIGRGDMLYKPSGSSPIRVQGCMITEEEIKSIVQAVQQGTNQHFNPAIEEGAESIPVKEKIAFDLLSPSASDDDLLKQATSFALDEGKISVSLLQRKLRIGYARASRLMDEMEFEGIVSPKNGNLPRSILITREEYESMQNKD